MVRVEPSFHNHVSGAHQIAHANATTAVVTDGLIAGENVVTSAIRNPIQGMAVATLDNALDQAPDEPKPLDNSLVGTKE